MYQVEAAPGVARWVVRRYESCPSVAVRFVAITLRPCVVPHLRDIRTMKHDSGATGRELITVKQHGIIEIHSGKPKKINRALGQTECYNGMHLSMDGFFVT